MPEPTGPGDRHGPGPGRRAQVGRRTALALGAGLGAAAVLGACGSTDPPPRTVVTGSPVGSRHEVGEARRIPYATTSRRQVGDLYLPAGTGSDGTRPLLPVVVVIHGGGWSSSSDLGSAAAISRDLASFGLAVWNIEYRGNSGAGSWPRTYGDVAAAVDFVPRLGDFAAFRPDRGSVHVTGHSAGGSLAAWVASRPALPAGAPGARVRQPVHSCVGMSGVYDLAMAYRQGDRFVRSVLAGTPEQRPRRYRLASPAANLPTGIPVTVLHGRADDVVPAGQAERYARAARRAGDPVELLLMDGVDHGGWTDPDSPIWWAARSAVLGHLGR